MRLYEQPCAAVQVGRKRYPLRLTYDRVLFVLDALKDPLLTDQDRLRLALGLLMRGRVPRSFHLQEQLLNAIMAAIDHIRNDDASIFIFPEGTRSRTGELAEFKGGSFKIATRTNCPIIPVAISNTAAIFEKHKPFMRKTPVAITFCDPIELDQLAPEQKKHIADYTREIIRKQQEEDTAMLQAAH